MSTHKHARFWIYIINKVLKIFFFFFLPIQPSTTAGLLLGCFDRFPALLTFLTCIFCLASESISICDADV